MTPSVHLRWLLFAGILYALPILGCGYDWVQGADVVVSRIMPAAIAPAAKNRVELQGAFGPGSPRIWNSLGLTTRILEHSREKVVLEIDTEPTTPVGPFGLWIATEDGPSNMLTLVVDDLPLVVESQGNHAREQAQPVPMHSAVVAQCEGTQFDYFRIACRQGEPVRMEIIAQRMQSTMDPVLRVLDERGKSLALYDDMPGSVDCRGIFDPPATGDFILEVQDNRFAGGGAYLLRVGDFPLISSLSPTVMSPFSTWVSPRGDEHGVPSTISLRPICNPPSPMLGIVGGSHIATLPIRREQGKGSSWTRLGMSDLPVIAIPETDSNAKSEWQLPVPCGISGGFETPQDRDTFCLQATAGERLQFRVSTASLGYPTQLRLFIHNQEGKVLEQSPIADGDEWVLNWVPPKTERLQCEVRELLGRSGTEFAYYLEIRPGGTFEASVKFDANTKDRAAIESAKGGFFVDLAIERTGYEGPIRVAVTNPQSIVEILNPIIPTGAKESRLYLLAKPNVATDALSHLKLQAEALDYTTPVASRFVPVSNLGLLRQKAAHQPYPYAFQTGGIPVAVVPTQAPYYKLPDSLPVIKIHWSMLEQQTPISLERLHADFKSPFQVAVGSLPTPSVQVEAKVENDKIQCVIRRTSRDVAFPDHVTLKVYAEFQNRVRWEAIELPIEFMKQPDPIATQAPDEGLPPEPNLPPSLSSTGGL